MDGPEWAGALRKSQRDPRMIHRHIRRPARNLAKDDQADWSSYFPQRWVRDEAMWTLEEGVRAITQVPAALLGFTDRGVLRAGPGPTMMIFDPQEIAPTYKEFVPICPAGVGRYKAYGKASMRRSSTASRSCSIGELTGRMPGMVVAPQLAQRGERSRPIFFRMLARLQSAGRVSPPQAE